MNHPPVLLVNFATPDFRTQQLIQAKSAIEVGIDCVSCWSKGRLMQKPFFTDHIDTFRYSPGFGCWLWKPYIIKDELARIPENGFLIYWDVGRWFWPHRFECFPQPLLELCTVQDGILPGVYIPQFGPNRCWTKRDCFVAMGCDSEKYWEPPQVQATISVWAKTPSAMAFVDEWLEWCTRREVLTDEPNQLGAPNMPGFREHRHDQSVLTNLVIKRGLQAFGSQRDPLVGDDKDLNNLVDAASGRHDRILARERRKRLRIMGNKITNPDSWMRKLSRIRAVWGADQRDHSL